jgi:hypothetical protein
MVASIFILNLIGLGVAAVGFLLCWPAAMYYRTLDGFPLIPSRRSPQTPLEIHEANKGLKPGNEGVGMAFRWGVRLIVFGAAIFVLGQLLEHLRPFPDQSNPLPATPADQQL